MKSISIRDVARLAGCSPGSASAAIRSGERVSAHLRQRVLRACQELGYSPRRRAGAAVQTARTSGLRSVLVFDACPDGEEPRPMSAVEALIEGIRSALRRRLYDFYCLPLNHMEGSRLRVSALIREGGVDVLAAYHLAPGDPLLWQAWQAGVKIVFMGSPPPHLPMHSVRAAQEAALFEAWSKLVEHGHGRIGVWTRAGALDGQARRAHERIRSMARYFPSEVRKTLIFKGVCADEELLEPCARLDAMLRAGVTAFIAANRADYVELRRILKASGLSAPRNCSIAVTLSSLDSALIKHGASGPRFDLNALGEEMGRMMIHASDHPHQAPRQVCVPPQWQEGCEIAAPPV